MESKDKKLYFKAFSPGQALILAQRFIEESIWFECCPYPSDMYMMTVKNEEPARSLLKINPGNEIISKNNLVNNNNMLHGNEMETR